MAVAWRGALTWSGAVAREAPDSMLRCNKIEKVTEAGKGLRCPYFSLFQSGAA